MPLTLGPENSGTITVNFSNTGSTDMPAPLLVLQGPDNALLTLDQSKSGQALDTTTFPPGFSSNVQILASGETPGILKAGESASVPVYFCGLLKPWDPNQTSVDFTLSSFETNNTTVIDWPAIKDSMRPDSIGSDAWNPIWANFTANMGSTWGNYVARLGEDASYLGSLGQQVVDAGVLFGFEIFQADGLNPAGRLESAVDASVEAPGLPITFSRSFPANISGRYEPGPLGRGWSHSWQLSLATAADGSVTIKGPGGSNRSFYPDGSGGYTSQPGDYATLSAAGGGTFLLTETSGFKTVFAADGKLSYVEDTNGNRITAGYSGENLTSLNHSSGQSLTIVYNANGSIATINDPGRGTTTFTYDISGEHLTSVTGYDAKTTSYTYIAGEGATKEHALAEIAYPGGNHRYYTYDASGRLSQSSRDGIQETVTYAYGPGGRIDATDANGATSSIFIDHQGLNLKTVDPLGSELTSTYDSNYNLTGITDPAGKSYNYAYDSRGNMVSSTDPTGHTTQFSYGDLSRMTSLTDANVNLTTYAYDAYGNTSSITYPDGNSESWNYDAKGNPTAKTNGRGHVIGYAYDSAGRVIQKSYADGTTMSYSYDGVGNLVSTSDPNGTTSFAYIYDLLSRIDYPGGRYLEFTYDDAGRRTSSTDQLGHRLDYHYDQVGRLETMTNENNEEIVRYEYDAAGRLVRKTVGNGGYTTYEYNAAGQLLHLINCASDDSVLSRFDYTYDSRGRRTVMGMLDGTWTYEYDDLGQLTHAVLNSTNPEVPSQDLTYNYDAMGNRISTVENGVTVNYTTNNMNQYTQTEEIKTENLPLSLELTSVYWASYADYGARQLSVAVAISNPNVDNAFDAKITDSVSTNGVSIASPLPASAGDIPAGGQVTVTLKYTVPSGVGSFKVSLKGSAKDSGGGTHHYPSDLPNNTTYTYDADGNLVQEISPSETDIYTYNDENRLVGISAPGVTTQYTYDANGNRVIFAQNGVNTNCVIDPAGFGNVVGEYDSSGMLIAHYNYGAGLINRADSANNASYYNFDVNGNAAEIIDESNQVINKNSYDPFGNMLLMVESIDNPFEFVGEYGVSKMVSSKYFMRERSYAPKVGRFLSGDPATAMNDYQYAANSPTGRIDPSGLWYLNIGLSGGKGIGATKGYIVGSGGIWSYTGAGAMTPGLGAAITYGQGDPAEGWSTQMQVAAGPGVVGGAYSRSWSDDDGSVSSEGGIGIGAAGSKVTGAGVMRIHTRNITRWGGPSNVNQREIDYMVRDASRGMWRGLFSGSFPKTCPVPNDPSQSASYSSGGLSPIILSITRVSTDSSGNEGNSDSDYAAISADGRYVAFHSNAANLVPGDTNESTDIFIKDTQTSVTTRVSTDSAGTQGNSDSGSITGWYSGRPTAISANGRYVAFSSDASNLVPGDTNGASDTFVKDTMTGVITRVSTDSAGNQGNSDSAGPDISADGRYVAFSSEATNLVPGDTNMCGSLNCSDVFVKDTQTGVTARVSVDAAGNQWNKWSQKPSISANGRYVAFEREINAFIFSTYVKDTLNGTTLWIDTFSLDYPGYWVGGNNPSISADGRYVAFSSESANLVPGDTNGMEDTFVKDTMTGVITRVSTDSAGNQQNKGSRSRPAISANGRYVAFSSEATNLVPGDTNGMKDTFVKDTMTGVITRVSTDSAGNQQNKSSYTINSISADGRYVAFLSGADNLVPGDTNGFLDIFLVRIR